jgi:hypothetical protein
VALVAASLRARTTSSAASLATPQARSRGLPQPGGMDRGGRQGRSRLLATVPPTSTHTEAPAVRLVTATLGTVNAARPEVETRGGSRSRWRDSDAGGVVAVPAVLARPLASPVAQGDFVGTLGRVAFGGNPSWLDVATPGRCARSELLAPRQPPPARSSTAPGRSAGCPSARLAALAVPTRRDGGLGGWPSIPMASASARGKRQEADRLSGPWRSSITRCGGGTSRAPRSTKNGIRHPAVTARRSARCPGSGACARAGQGAWPSPDAGSATRLLGRSTDFTLAPGGL